MKPEELMIGDWVIRRGVPEEPMWLSDMKTIAGIVYLDQDGRGVAEKFENIEPIPLTPKILEKNKFLEDSNGIFYLKENLKFGLKKDIDYGYWFVFRRDNEYICTCDFVHELQHILKLQQIEKEIVP